METSTRTAEHITITLTRDEWMLLAEMAREGAMTSRAKYDAIFREACDTGVYKDMPRTEQASRYHSDPEGQTQDHLDSLTHKFTDIVRGTYEEGDEY